MDIYSDTLLHIDNYCSKGLLFHPETILGYHLSCNNLKIKHTYPVCYFSDTKTELNGYYGDKRFWYSPYTIALIAFRYIYNNIQSL